MQINQINDEIKRLTGILATYQQQISMSTSKISEVEAKCENIMTMCKNNAEKLEQEVKNKYIVPLRQEVRNNSESCKAHNQELADDIMELKIKLQELQQERDRLGEHTRVNAGPWLSRTEERQLPRATGIKSSHGNLLNIEEEPEKDSRKRRRMVGDKPTLTISSYDGRSQAFLGYWSQCNIVAENNGWDEETLKAQIVGNLKGEALNQMIKLGTNLSDFSLAQLKDLLEGRFGNKLSKEEATRKLA
jgi:predicted RNase H-like nuclease (RuvC/YqgF family)